MKTPSQWAVVELLGHRRLIGKIYPVAFAGGTLLAIEVIDASTPFTSYINVSAIYALTPVTEEAAKDMAGESHYPITPHLLEAQPTPSYAVSLQDLDGPSAEDLLDDQDPADGLYTGLDSDHEGMRL